MAKMAVPDCEKEIESLRDRVQKVMEEVQAKDKQIDELDGIVARFECQHKWFPTMRKHFLSSYKQDRLDNGTPKDSDVTEPGKQIRSFR